MRDPGRLSRIEAGDAVFGPTLDALLRDIAPRLSNRPDLLELIEFWPMENPGAAQDGKALFDRLMLLRATLPPPPSAALPAGRAAGSAGRAVLGAILCGCAGLPLGFLAYMVVRATVLPPSLWSSDVPMWGITGGIAAAAAGLGTWHGARPTRQGHAMLRGLGGFLAGAVAGALGAGILAGMIGAALGVLQREGAFAMSVAFSLMPIGGLLTGLALAAWMARSAWRRW